MKPMEGEVLLNGKRIEEPGLDRGIVFQEPALFPWLTALRNVAFGLEMGGMGKRAVNERAAQVLRIVGLERAMHLYPFQLSGGMKHRVAVARAWALTDASVLLMDEPFSAIDAINRMALQKYLVDAWLAEPRTVIYVTHDIDEAVYLAVRIARRKALLSAPVLVLAPYVAKATDPDPVRFGVLYPNLTTVIHAIAKKTGVYEKHNLKIVETRFKSGQTVEGVEQLWRGNLD